MKPAKWARKTALVIMMLGTVGLWLWPMVAAAALVHQGIRVDAGSSQNITFTWPGNTPQIWLRVVTDPGITPLEFTIQRVTNGSPRVIKSVDGNNQSLPVGDNLLNPIADAVYQFNVPVVNVYSIKLDNSAYSTPPANQDWTLTVANKSSALGIFAIYISTTQSDTEGPNVWLRDNATVDPSGYHTLSNINNLDITQIPTPNEWWKSPSIRFTDSSGTPTKNPVQGQNNNIYIRVHNFGTLPLSSVTIEAYWTHFITALPPFGDPAWNPLGVQTVANIDPGTSQETPAFVWQNVPVPNPTQPNHYCIFARVTAATAAGNLNVPDYSSTVVDWLTPHNMSATHRNVMIISSVDPPPSGPFPFFFRPPIRFYVNNPTEFNIVTELSVKGLPVLARASEILFQQRPEDNIELIGLQRLAASPTKEEGGTRPGTVAMQSSTGQEAVAPGMTRYGIVANERLGFSNLILKPGEKRLVEIRLAISEPLKELRTIPFDAIQLVNGKPIGGVTAVLEITKAEPPGFPNWCYLIILVLIVIVILIALKKKQCF